MQVFPRVLWLKTGMSNNNPKIIAGHYLECVKTMKGTVCMYTSLFCCDSNAHYHISVGCPTLVRTDLGTENSTVAFLQPFLRRNGTDSLSSMKSF